MNDPVRWRAVVARCNEHRVSLGNRQTEHIDRVLLRIRLKRNAVSK
jgi:hypothetical protein